MTTINPEIAEIAETLFLATTTGMCATPERYNKAVSDLAWQPTIDWFNKYVRG